MAVKKLFGTDGIRRKVGDWPLTHDGVEALGAAIGRFFLKYRNINRVLVIRDTRASGEGFMVDIAQGLSRVGCDALLGGVLPTGAAGYLAKTHTMGGIIISASHNPASDNGIKIILDDGFKISSGEERVVERLLTDSQEFSEELITDELLGRIEKGKETELCEEYLDFLERKTEEGAWKYCASHKVVVDCANGAASAVAPELFSKLSDGRAIIIGSDPDGSNINLGCGSEDLEPLIRRVSEENADAGFAFDGDGDRLIAVDEKGEIVDGDRIMAILAQHLKERGQLKGEKVVATPYSNLGLRHFLEKIGCALEIVPNGDRNVAHKMKKEDLTLGGEKSGHTIIMPPHTTGDGLLTALMVLNALGSSKSAFSSLHADFKDVPQVMINVSVREKTPLVDLPAVQQTIKEAQQDLGDSGRVLVRYSGTESKARVLVECTERSKAEELASRIVDSIQAEIGVDSS